MRLIYFCIFFSILNAGVVSIPNTCKDNSFPFTYEASFGKVSITKPLTHIAYIGSYAEMPALFNNWDKVYALSSYAFDSDLVKASLKEFYRVNKTHSILNLISSHTSAINGELLLDLKIDGIIAGAGSRNLIEAKKRFNINSIQVNALSMQNAYEDICNQARLIGEAPKALKLLNYYNDIYKFIDSKTKNLKKVNAVYIFQNIGTMAGYSGIDTDLLTYANVNNLSKNLIKSYRGFLSVEELIKLDPEVIYIWWVSSLKPEDLYKDKRLQSIKALRNKAVYKMPSIDIAGPRMAIISLFVASKAYPNAFNNLELQKLENDFYKEIFGEAVTKNMLHIFK